MYVKDPGALRRRRRELGLTQQQLAALVGTTQQYISLLEKGKDRDCSERVTSRICRWLEVERDDYFEEQRTTVPAPAVTIRTTPGRASLTLLLVTALVVLAPAPARAHFNGWDSVDSRQIRWEDHTTYDGARIHAIDAWNALGSVSILPDAWDTSTDMLWLDYSSRDGRCGYANWNGVPGVANRLYLNTMFMPGYTQAQRNACATHELGHHLGLGHSSATQVMDGCPVCSSSGDPLQTTPQGHDVADYRELWG